MNYFKELAIIIVIVIVLIVLALAMASPSKADQRVKFSGVSILTTVTVPRE